MSGVCCDALNQGGAPSPGEIRAAGADGARVVAFDDGRFFDYCHLLQDADLTVAVVIARESCATDDYGGWAAYYAERCWPRYWLIGNEFDAWMLPVESPSSWSMPPAEYAQLFKACAEAIQSRQPNAEIFMGGVVAGQPAIIPEYLAAIREIYAGPIDGLDVHPYTHGVDRARELLRAYAEVWDDYFGT